MLTIILHHSALELVNESICNVKHSAIQNDSIRRKKPDKELLLDLSVHQSAIYPEKVHFAGRPDLVHIFLLQYHFIMDLMDSAIESKIQLYVHTRNDKVFAVPAFWRVPVHFLRFRGLMEKFLIEKEISLGKAGKLILQEQTLGELVKNLSPDEIINLVETGEKTFKLNFATKDLIIDNTNTVLLIGGYQKGEYDLSKEISFQIKKQKIIDKPTTSWMILNLLLTGIIEKK